MNAPQFPALNSRPRPNFRRRNQRPSLVQLVRFGHARRNARLQRATGWPNITTPVLLACSSPEILIGQIAARTSTLRVGSGGVMLPNHAPLKVAENFRTLETLFPHRIDLGLGRAPGTDPRTANGAARRARPAQRR